MSYSYKLNETITTNTCSKKFGLTNIVSEVWLKIL